MRSPWAVWPLVLVSAVQTPVALALPLLLWTDVRRRFGSDPAAFRLLCTVLLGCAVIGAQHIFWTAHHAGLSDQAANDTGTGGGVTRLSCGVQLGSLNLGTRLAYNGLLGLALQRWWGGRAGDGATEPKGWSGWASLTNVLVSSAETLNVFLLLGSFTAPWEVMDACMVESVGLAQLLVPYYLRVAVSGLCLRLSVLARRRALRHLEAFAWRQAQLPLWRRVGLRYTAKLTRLLHPVLLGQFLWEVGGASVTSTLAVLLEGEVDRRALVLFVFYVIELSFVLPLLVSLAFFAARLKRWDEVADGLLQLPAKSSRVHPAKIGMQQEAKKESDADLHFDAVVSIWTSRMPH